MAAERLHAETGREGLRARCRRVDHDREQGGTSAGSDVACPCFRIGASNAARLQPGGLCPGGPARRAVSSAWAAPQRDRSAGWLAQSAQVPIVGARKRRARSSAGEHYVDIVGVAGSIPAAPTTDICRYRGNLAVWPLNEFISVLARKRVYRLPRALAQVLALRRQAFPERIDLEPRAVVLRHAE